MKRNKKLKKIIMGSVGFAMAVVVFFVGSMQNMQEVAADIRVFDKITETYPDSDQFNLNILEIVPTGTMVTNDSMQVNSAAEIGYFLPYNNADDTSKQPATPTITSYGAALATPLTSRDDPTYGEALYNLRTYGMIRPYGEDTAGEYPIYAWYNSAGISVFSNYKNDFCENAYSQSFVKGVYSFGTGFYNIAAGYSIDENGNICEVKQTEVVSTNSSLSVNNPNYDPETNMVTEYIPVDDIDESSLSLPRSKTGAEYITYVADGTGSVTFTRSESNTNMTEYYGYSDQVLYYMKNSNAYFYNSSYFKEYVLGSKKSYSDRTIDYNVVQASAVTTEQVEAADLIYISGKDATFAASGDISEKVLLAIYNKEVTEHKAVMMDYACYGKDSDTNISKLAVLLWRESQSDIRTTYAKYYAENTDDLNSLEFMKGDALADLKSSMLTGANGNFVTNNVYVYNHHLSDFDDPKSLIDAGDMFANGDFNSAYKASVMQAGFSEVLNYITATNKNSTTGSMLPSVTPAVAIQYILISDGKALSVVKTSLNVLEIQPTTEFLYNEERGSEEYGYLDEDGDVKENRDYFVKNYLGSYYDDKVEYVTFTSMSVDEFNGRNEDLIETYDIVYIGSEIGNLYYTGTIQSRVKENGVYTNKFAWQSGIPVYNDGASMNGNVYYNIGDIMTVDNANIAGWLDTGTSQNRYASRDLTKNKLEKLKAYLDAEGLVFVAGDLVAQINGVVQVNPTAHGEWQKETLDNGRIDNSSNLYEFMQYALGYRFNSQTGDYETGSIEGAYKVYSNLISVGDIEAGLVEKSLVDQYVATEKLVLTITAQPREYSYSLQAGSQVMDPDTIQYLEEEPDGTRKLKYEFVISSDIDNVTGTATYTPYLYVDVNNDGKYSHVAENIRDMQIIVKASGAEAERDANNNYILYKDTEYLMTRELDESYSGYIKWKISIQSNIYQNSHASAEGSTVIKNKGDNKLVKILQITKDNNTATAGLQTNLNLQEQAADPTSKFGKYLAAVPGYDVVIRTMSVSEFEQDFVAKWVQYDNNAPEENKKSLQEYALDYFNSIEIRESTTANSGDAVIGANMLVLGFGDDFTGFTYTATIEAVKSYMESEKPVLLAHDFIMFRYVSNQAKFLRNIVGMDKYGMTQNITTETIGNQEVTKLINYVNYITEASGEKYLHSGKNYTRSGNQKEVSLIESTGKAVAYQPGSGREVILGATQGVSNGTLNRFKKTGNGWLNSNALGAFNDNGAATYTVDKLNEGQITSYPYALPDSFTVASTHGQYFQLDLDADDDGDGESDVVVWYTLGKSGRSGYDPWNNNTGGSIPNDGFYIYNKGNITYTGAGHADMATGSSEVEAQLFINTLFAAFNASHVEPGVGFYENVPDANSTPINGLAVPYDENVTGDNAIDSSVLKDANGVYRYHFVNPNVTAAVADLGTPMFFRLTDTNFVRGTKYMEIEYYLKVKGDVGDAYKLDDGSLKTIEVLSDEISVPVVNISDKMTTYNIANRAFSSEISRDVTTGKVSFLESGVVYGFYLPLSYLNDESQVTIYIKAKTRVYTASSQTGLETVTEVPGVGIGELTVTKTDLLDLD